MNPHMQNYTYRDCRMHTRIPVCIRAEVAKIFAYGDPHLHNKIVRILGATYTRTWRSHVAEWLSDALSIGGQGFVSLRNATARVDASC